MISATINELQKQERINNIVEEQTNGILNQVVYDRYIEFKVPEDNKNALLIGAKEDDSKKLPISYPYVERQKIDWVDKKLGTDEDIMKIETVNAFKYDYADGTSYQIYQCSDQHTVNSFFADPNSNINIANYVVIYNSMADAVEARRLGETPATKKPTITPVFGARKIVGYSSDTGEVRVMDAFEYAPTNGMVYRLFEYDSSTNFYKEIEPSFGKVFTKANAKCYNINGIIGDGAKYYTDDNCTQNEQTIKDGTNIKFQFNNTGYSAFNDNGTTYYIPTPEPYKVPTQTEYYLDKEKTKYGGFVGYAYEMETAQRSGVVYRGVKYYIKTPQTNRVLKGTTFYKDSKLLQVGGVFGADYNVYNKEYSTIKIGDSVYKIATPLLGKTAKFTPSFKEKELTTLNGVYGTDYTLSDVDVTVGVLNINGKDYFSNMSDIRKVAKAGTVYYSNDSFEEPQGILTTDTNYTIESYTVSYVLVNSNKKYIKTPLKGEVISATGANVKFYSEAGVRNETTLVGEVMPIGADYLYLSNRVSRVDDNHFIGTPQRREVNTSAGDVKYYNLVGPLNDSNMVGVIKPYKNITYSLKDTFYSQVGDVYIKTPTTNYVPFNTEYFSDEGFQTSLGNFRTIDIDLHYTNYNYATFMTNTTNYYCDIPSTDISYISFDTPYYRTNQLQYGGQRLGYITHGVGYSFYKFLGVSDSSCSISVANVTHYTKVPYAKITGDYFEASYAGTTPDSVKYYTVKIGEQNYYVKDSETETEVDPQGNNYSKEFYAPQLIGGSPITNDMFVVLNNIWNVDTRRLFIQPNINIKTDAANPNEIVFVGGVNDKIRIDISKVETINPDNGKKVDITINKLDNTQWMIEGNGLKLVESSMPQGMIYPQTIPQSDYTIYTSFIDSSPYNIFYARTSPNIEMKFKNLDGDASYNDITQYSVRANSKYYADSLFTQEIGRTPERLSCDFNGVYGVITIDGIQYYVQEKEGNIQNINRYFNFRDVKFKTYWSSVDDTLLPQVKYYKYTLYSTENALLTELQASEDKYSTDLEWVFRGLDGAVDQYHSEKIPHSYKVKIEICDEHDKVYSIEKDFNIFYQTEVGANPLMVGDDTGEDDICEENCLNVVINAPTIISSVDTSYTNDAGTEQNYTKTVFILESALPVTYNTYPEELQGKKTVYMDPDHNPLDSNGSLNINKGEILNYAKAFESDGSLSPYDLPSTMGMFAEIKITNDFISSISYGQDKIILAVSHNTNDIAIQNDTSYQRLTEDFYLKIHSFSPYKYVVDSSNNIVIEKDEKTCLISLWKRNYKGELTQVQDAFMTDGMTYPYYDIIEKRGAMKTSVNIPLNFALQKSDAYLIYDNYNSINWNLPGIEKKKIVLLNSVQSGSILKNSGVFKVGENNTLIPVDEEYLYLTNISQFSYDNGIQEDGHEFIYYNIKVGTPYYNTSDVSGTSELKTTEPHNITRTGNEYTFTLNGETKWVREEDVFAISLYVDDNLLEGKNLHYLIKDTSGGAYKWIDDSMYSVKYQGVRTTFAKTMMVYLKINNLSSIKDGNGSITTNEKVSCEIAFIN